MLKCSNHAFLLLIHLEQIYFQLIRLADHAPRCTDWGRLWLGSKLFARQWTLILCNLGCRLVASKRVWLSVPESECLFERSSLTEESVQDYRQVVQVACCVRTNFSSPFRQQRASLWYLNRLQHRGSTLLSLWLRKSCFKYLKLPESRKAGMLKPKF